MDLEAMGLMVVFCLCTLFSSTAVADDAFPEQPEEIPGDWRLQDDPMPPLEEVIGRSRGEVPVYGLYTWAGEYRSHRESINGIGWTTIRMSGPLDDRTMRFLAEDGTEVLYTLGSSSVMDFRTRPDFGSDEEFISAYHSGVREFLNRYGPEGEFFKDNPDVPDRPVRYVNIWNEPNFHYMIPDDPERPRAEVEAEREALYADLMVGTYELIKSEWPEVNVAGFSAGGAGAGDLRWIRNLHEKNEAIAHSYDILATQPYVEPAPPEAHSVRGWGSYSLAGNLHTIRGTLAEHGREDAPVWYTEIGWPVSHEDGGHFTMERNELVSPHFQAAYVVRLYALAMRLGVERVHIMFATDTDNYNAGFFLRDGTWRPSARAVENMIERMPRPKLTGAVADGEDGYYAYRFSPHGDDGESVIMAWNVTGPRTVEIPVEGGERVTVYDMFGNEREETVRRGSVQIVVGPYPLYVEIPQQ